MGTDIPNGYSAIDLKDTQTGKVTRYLIPKGNIITFFNGKEEKTYDPSKTKNNVFTFTGTKDEAGFRMMGLALEHMDANNDGRIDTKDTDHNIGKKINKDKRLPKNAMVDQVDPSTYHATVHQGEGYVKYNDTNTGEHGHMGETRYYVGIDNPKTKDF